MVGDYRQGYRVYESISSGLVQLGVEIKSYRSTFTLSEDGSVLAVADENELNTGNILRVYELVASQWIPMEQPSIDLGADIKYNFAVALSRNGSILAIGSWYDSDSDRVRVYEWNSNAAEWIQLGIDIAHDILVLLGVLQFQVTVPLLPLEIMNRTTATGFQCTHGQEINGLCGD
jgi:hypothetical protein